MNPRLSIVIPVHNGAKTLPQLLEELESARGSEDFEILVGDDASEDQTWGFLQSHTDQRLRSFHFPKNIGAGAVRNELIQKAKGEFIALQDADDSFSKDRFAKQIQFLDSHPQFGAVGTWAKLEEEGEEWGKLRPPEHPRWIDWVLKRSVVHATVMFRRDQMGSAKYHGQLRFGEDYYFLLQLFHQGIRFSNLSEELYTYKISERELRTRGRRFWKELVKMDLVLAPLFPWGQRWIYFGVNSCKLLYSVLRSSLWRPKTER
ncbi:MAG: hypothetical protein CL676_08165 [Bdellovibrionaceae bacterium]|nr:hypothetical protein [Pseudobdellovibrionaceae bacterium]|tara:strand:- start:1120 stop:1902 length:783 start_codon:yes stop_codon:yes gene_type:complete